MITANELRRNYLTLAGAAVLATLAACSPPPAGTYSSPEEAVQAIADLAGTGDTKKVEEIFGPGGLELLQSGDEVADREDALRVKEMILEKVAFEDDGDAKKIAVVGNDGWRFPLPLVLENDRWRFDAEAGREELQNRRIGRNELLALASLHAYVDAQRDYFAQAPRGTPAVYARRILSSEGKHDGLYWPAQEGETESPLGPLYGEAAEDRDQEAARFPFNGYFFRILEAQGKSAPGGERSYVDKKGLMTQGFAAIAWPAKYGNSGIMTFQVDEQGLVFQKDLGAETETAVETISTYDPDESWNPTGD